MDLNGYDNETTRSIDDEDDGNDGMTVYEYQEDMTTYECLRKIKEAGGSYEFLADKKVKLRVPSTAAHLTTYVNAHYDDIKAALRVQTWEQPISATDLLDGWKRAMDAGILDAIKVRVYPDRDYMKIDHIQLAENEEICRIFCPENF